MKKYILPRLFQIPRIYYIITSFFFPSYHRFMKKYILYKAFPNTSHLLYYYVILFAFVSSYHEKIYLTQRFQIPCIYYISTSLFFALYHRIMKKHILPRLFQIPCSTFTILLRHSFSLRIIVSWKNISYPGFSKYLEFTILLRRSFSLRIIVASYHEKIYLTQAFPNSSHLLYYYVILFALCIIISWKNISYPAIFQLPRIYYINTSFFFASYHRIMKKYILPRLFNYRAAHLLYYYVILSHFVTSYHEKICLS